MCWYLMTDGADVADDRLTRLKLFTRTRPADVFAQGKTLSHSVPCLGARVLITSCMSPLPSSLILVINSSQVLSSSIDACLVPLAT